MPSRQPHDDGARAQAKQLYLTHGTRRTAELTGIPERTIRAWASAGNWRQPDAATGQPRHLRVAPVAAGQPAPAKGGGHGWQPYAVLDRLAAELWHTLDDLDRWRSAGKARDARDTAVVAGVLVDKCQGLAKQIGHEGGGLDADASLAGIMATLDAIERRQAGGSAPR